MNTDLKHLQQEQAHEEEVAKSLSGNPFKRVIQELFHEEFSGVKYKNYTAVSGLALVTTKFDAILVNYRGIYLPGATALIRSLKKAKTMEALLMKMNEYLFN